MLELQHISFGVEQDGESKDILRDINLTINERFVAITGPNGGGKSTLAKVIAGILTPTQGRILLDGEDLLHAGGQRIRAIQGKDICVVFQEPMSAMDPTMRIGKQVEECLRVHTDLSAQERRQRALQALRDVELPDPEGVYRKYPHELSGGMLQRVMIAAAIVARPRLLLADEPTTALDVTIQAQVLEMIYKLKSENNTSMILITHDLGVVAQNCDYVAIIYAGEVVEYGTLREIYKDTKHPYTEGLFGSIPSLTSDVKRLQAIDGMMPDPTKLPEGCVFCERCKYAVPECSKTHPGMVTVGGTHQVRCIRYR